MYRLFYLVILLCIGCSSILEAQIINVEERRKEVTDSIQWFEKLSVGFDLFQNEETVVSLQGKAFLQFAFKNKTLISITNARFVRAGGERFVNQGFQHLRYNSDLNPWLTYELFGQVQFNEQAFIKLRTLAGTGPRFQIINSNKSKMHLGVSYMYEYDEEKNGEIHQDNRMSSYLSFNLQPTEFMSMNGTVYYQPLFNQFSDFRLSAGVSVEFTISKNLSFSTQYVHTYDSRQPEGAPNEIINLSNLISYSF